MTAIKLLEALIALERLIQILIERTKRRENERAQAATSAAVEELRNARTREEKIAAAARLRESFRSR